MAAKNVQTKALTQRGRFWARHLHQWLQSGRSQAQYCRQHHLSLSALQWWRGQLPKDLWSNRTPEVSPSKPKAFVELPIDQETQACYEISLRGGRSLRLGSRFDPVHVRQLVLVLEQTC